MPNPQISPGRAKIAYIQGQDAGGSPRVLGSLSATIDNYTAAYVAKYPDAISFGVVPKVTPAAGATVTVTVTLHGTDEVGGALPPLVMQFDLLGPDPGPLATQLVNIGITDTTAGGMPADPGSPTAILV